MTEEKELKDLFETELSDGTYINSWTDGELTFLSIRFITLAIPNELFDELLEFLTNHHRSKNPKKNQESYVS